jgi:hypothetical protein
MTGDFLRFDDVGRGQVAQKPERDQRLNGRRPFQSEQGLVDLCPAKTEKGDLLCVLAGMSGPVILRRI